MSMAREGSRIMKTAVATGDMQDKPSCPKCGSSNVYYRLKKGFCCRRCGNQFKIEKKDSVHDTDAGQKKKGKGGA
jgi:transposase-like protein